MPPQQAYWLRAVAPLPDDKVMHRVLLAYASDIMLLSSSLLPHGISSVRGDVQEASLDPSCGFTAPSASTTGCFTRKTALGRAVPAG